MKLENLKPSKGAVHSVKRIARGEGSGYGGTAGKGTKGQQSRTGYKTKRGHEGGQMPIQRRLPKRGFKNINRIDYKVFNVGQVEALVERYALPEFSIEELYMHGLISRTDLVKILANGEIASKVTFKVNAVSQKAKEVIEAAGGTVELVG